MTMKITDGSPYMDQVKNLIIEYTKRLGRDLSFQHLDDELKNPAEKYTAPEGEILAAVDEHGIVHGIVAYHRLSDTRCEMKRLYVQPDARGEHLGYRLISEIIDHARKAGYREMVLDTLRPLHSAIHLYHQFGFEECRPYYDNPFKDVIYMSKDLTEEKNGN